MISRNKSFTLSTLWKPPDWIPSRKWNIYSEFPKGVGRTLQQISRFRNGEMVGTKEDLEDRLSKNSGNSSLKMWLGWFQDLKQHWGEGIIIIKFDWIISRGFARGIVGHVLKRIWGKDVWNFILGCQERWFGMWLWCAESQCRSDSNTVYLVESGFCCLRIESESCREMFSSKQISAKSLLWNLFHRIWAC